MSRQGSIAAEVLKPLDQAADGLGAILSVEVITAQGGVHGAVAKHAVGGDGKDGLVGTATCLDTQELRSKVAGLGARNSTGGAHQDGLDPDTALAQAGESSLAGAWEARHVHADLRRQDAAHQVTDPGNRREQAGALLARREHFSHSRIQFAQPIGQFEQLAGLALEAPHLLMHGRRVASHVRHDGVLVYVQAHTAHVRHSHENLFAVDGRRRQSSSSNSAIRALGRRRPVRHSGALAGLRVQLLNGFAAPCKRRVDQQRPRSSYNDPPSIASPDPCFMPRGRAHPTKNHDGLAANMLGK